jgi:ankyrin repeat protein
LIFENGAEIDFENFYGSMPLMQAAEQGYEAVLELLLANGAEVNAYNDGNDTALSLAAQEGHGGIVKRAWFPD